MLCPKSLRNRQMDGVSLVGQIRKKLQALVSDESRGWGDAANALRRIAVRECVSHSYLWRILYRHRELKDVRSSVLFKVTIAHRLMCERQLRRFEDERREAEATGWVTEAVLRAAACAAGEIDQPDDERNGR